MSRIRWLPGFMLAIVLSVTLACGGGGDDDSDDATETPAETAEETPDETEDSRLDEDLEAYFEDLEFTANAIEERLNLIQTEYSEQTFDTTQDEIDGFVILLLDTQTSWETTMDAVADYEPPPEIESEHQDLIDAGNDVITLLGELAEGAEDVTTEDELDALIADFDAEISEANDAFDEACFALQDIADDENIDVDLRCGDEDNESGASADLEGYFTDLEALIIVRDAEQQDAVDEHNSGDWFGDPEGEYESVKVMIGRSVDVYDAFLADASDLSPPLSVTEQHDAFIDASEAYSEIVNDNLEGVEAAGNISDATDFAENNTDIDTGRAAYAGACRNLQAIADLESIDVDLACEG